MEIQQRKLLKQHKIILNQTSVILMYIFNKLGIKIKKILFEPGELIVNNTDCDIIVANLFRNQIPEKIPHKYYIEKDNSAVLNITTYEKWWRDIGNKTRNLVRKAEKSGLKCVIKSKLSKQDTLGIWKIFNETPIRQNRFAKYYGTKLNNISDDAENGLFFLTYKESELVGYIHLIFSDINIAHINTILSLNKCFELAPNNFLISEVVKYCSKNKIQKLTYGRMNIPSLNKFKQNNGFVEEQAFVVIIPLTKKGNIAKILRLCKSPKDFIPNKIKPLFMPVFAFFSRIYANIYVVFNKVKVD